MKWNVIEMKWNLIEMNALNEIESHEQMGVETRSIRQRVAKAARAFFIQQLSWVKLQKWTRLKKNRYQKMRLDSSFSSTTRQPKLDMTAITGRLISKAPQKCHEYQRVHQLCTIVKKFCPTASSRHKLCRNTALVAIRMKVPHTKTKPQVHDHSKWTKHAIEMRTKTTAETKMSK